MLDILIGIIFNIAVPAHPPKEEEKETVEFRIPKSYIPDEPPKRPETPLTLPPRTL
jgi:hypothetical protein